MDAIEDSEDKQELLDREQSSRVVLRGSSAGQISRWAVIASLLAGAVLLAAITRHVLPRSISLRVTKLVCYTYYQGCEQIEPWPKEKPSATDYSLADALQAFGKERSQIGEDFKEMVYGRLMDEMKWKDEAQSVHWSLTFLKESGLRETTQNRPWIFEHALSKNSWAASLMCDFDLVAEANRTHCEEAKDKLNAGFRNPQQAYMWNRMGLTGGHLTWNRWYNPKQCFLEAINRNGNMASAWSSLGETLKGWDSAWHWGQEIREVQAYVQSLNINSNYSEAWTNLGDSGGGTIKGLEYTQKHCYLRALMVKPDYAPAWRGLGDAGGFFHEGKDYFAKDCIEHALKLNPSDARAWISLSKIGGGMVDQKFYGKQECLQKSLDLQDPHPLVRSEAWKLLALVGGGMVNGTTYDARGCFEEGLAASPGEPDLWAKLGDEGGGKVKDKKVDKKDCYIKAISIIESKFNKRYPAPPELSLFQVNGSAWLGLGDAGGGKVFNRWYPAKDCYVAALWNEESFSHAWKRLGDLGGAHVAFRHIMNERQYSSMKSGDWYDEKRCREIAAALDEKSTGASDTVATLG